jgi:1-acyl-sn-glycerol-3-phosphate acyltransferase
LFYRFARYVAAVLYRLAYRVKVTGAENIPARKGVVICLNHARLADLIMVSAIVDRKLRFIAKKDIFENKALGFALRLMGGIPSDSRVLDLESYKAAMKLLRAGDALVMFRRGRRGVPIEAAGHNSDVMLYGIKAGVPFIPIEISSSGKPFSAVRFSIDKPVILEKALRPRAKNDLAVQLPHA